MKKGMSLTVRISVIVAGFVSMVIAVILVIVSVRAAAALTSLSIADNEQIARTRSLQIGEMLDKFYWQLAMIVNTEEARSGDVETVEQMTVDLKGTLSPEIIGAFFAWPDGSYMSVERARGNVRERDYFKDIFDSGLDRSVGEAVISKSLKVPIVVSAIAVKGEDGRTRGLLALQFKLDTLSAITENIRIGKTGYGWIIDKTGMMIAHPDRDAIMRMRMTDADKDGTKGLDALGAQALAEESGHGTYETSDGQEMTVFHVRIPNSPGWVLGVSVPTAEIRADAQKLQRILFIICVVFVVISVLVSVAIARSIARP